MLDAVNTSTDKLIYRVLTEAVGCHSGPLGVSHVDGLTGDCLGPLTGHLLVEKHNIPSFVYGTLEHPVTAKNLVETSVFIKKRHPFNKVVAVDAALGRDADIGIIRIVRGGLEPGSALGRRLPKVGDFSVTAIVAGLAQAEHILLQDTRLHLVFSLAEAIAAGLSEAVRAKLAS